VEELKRQVRQKDATLLYAAKDVLHNTLSCFSTSSAKTDAVIDVDETRPFRVRNFREPFR
jgi:hypothetical protein